MLNLKIVGFKISQLRKLNNFTQEKLAQVLHVTPQAISKWENGHTLPETAILPVIADIFGCTIDQILMPAYTTDENILNICNEVIDIQAEKIASKIIKNMGNFSINRNIVGLENEEVVNILSKNNPSLYSVNVEIKREKLRKTERSINTKMKAITLNGEINIIEKVLFNNKNELSTIKLLESYDSPIPQIYYCSLERGIVLMEDLSKDYIQGFEFDEDTENGKFIRNNNRVYMDAMVNMHCKYWEDKVVIDKMGLPNYVENLERHIEGIEKEYLKFKEDYRMKMSSRTFDILDDALELLKKEYKSNIMSRFSKKNNITLIHGDLNPGNIFISSKDKKVKFIDFEAVRVGICTEDLAMLLAYHIAPKKEEAEELLKYYHERLSEKVDGYSYGEFLKDYENSIIGNIFFSIKLINGGIPAFNILETSMIAYESFIFEGRKR